MAHATLKLSDLLRRELVLDLSAAEKKEALRELTNAAADDERVHNAEVFYQALMHREAQASTGIGLGLAIPHAKIPALNDNLLIVGRSQAGIPFDALDGAPVHLIFLIGASDRQTREFVRLLAAVTHVLKNDELRANLMRAEIPDEFINLLRGH